MKPSQVKALEIINKIQPHSILDAPCGDGWLGLSLNFKPLIDGIDLYINKNKKLSGYRNIFKFDLDLGIPKLRNKFDLIISCEGIEHFGNSDLFIKTAKINLKKNGTLIITTPNTWHPASRIQYLIRGFFPGFPCLVGKIKSGTHMHIQPWSFPQLYLYLKKNNFKEIKLHDVEEKKPKRFYEYFFAIPQLVYCYSKYKWSKNIEVREFFMQAGSKQSIFGRALVISAKKS
jgi:cyclopropane fatty-acyl-phospholipid synthase-like methyltransferase